MPTSDYINFYSYEQYCVKKTQLYKLIEIFINFSNIICLKQTPFWLHKAEGKII